MSASHRKLARLPLEIFDNLHMRAQSSTQQPISISSEGLRSQICNRLKRFPFRFDNHSSNHNSITTTTTTTTFTTTTTASIKTVGDLLRANKRTLLLALDPLLTFPELELLLRRICKICSAKPKSALRLRYLPTGLESLDNILQGGIRVGSVTELVGRAGAGRGGSSPSSFTFKSPQQVLANLTVETPLSTEELIQTLDAAEELILHRNQQATAAATTTSTTTGTTTATTITATTTTTTPIYPVRLLIVDSIAAPLTRDFGSDSVVQRSAAIFQCAQTLRRLAETLHLAVVVINQFEGKCQP
ncbi:MAG: hypothetical protein SGBAC_001840 [Bacillariaceae sp.]